MYGWHKRGMLEMQYELKLFFSDDMRILEKGNSVIVGNIVNGQWLKCDKEIFDFLSSCIKERKFCLGEIYR